MGKTNKRIIMKRDQQFEPREQRNHDYDVHIMRRQYIINRREISIKSR